MLTDAELTEITRKKYSFNWKKERGQNLFKLSIIGQKYIQGLISLEFYDSEYRVYIRLLAVSKENIGGFKVFERIAGSLFGYAARLAIERYGINAAISLRPKTELAQHYMDEYGFEQAGINLFLENKALEKLFKKYE